MDISKFLSIDNCSVALESRKADGVLKELADLIRKSPAAAEVATKDVVTGLIEREELGSTGFGDGLAIPHCKIPGMKTFSLALGISRHGVAFNAMDRRSVHIFCCIVGPDEKPELHLQLLATAARALAIGRVRYELLRSETSFALREAFLYHTAPATSTDISDPGKCQKLLMLVIQDENTYSEIMELFLELGVVGAVTHESNMMGPVLSNVPIFAGFMDVLGRSRPEPKTVYALVPESSLDGIVSAIEEITGNLDTHRGACIIVLSPDLIRGSLETL